MNMETALDQSSTILIADDHPLFREALQQVVGEAFPLCVCLEAKDFESALRIVRQNDSIELILLDLNMPGMQGFSGLITLRNLVPMTPIVIVSATEDSDIIHEATTYGASGFITKALPRETMIRALNEVLSGEIFVPEVGEVTPSDGPQPLSPEDQEMQARMRTLTAQQLVVLEMLVEGKSNKIIAYELDIAESTVKAHVSAILRKLRVHSRTQAVIMAGKLSQTLSHARERKIV